jgi:hypothetical protein
MQGILPNEFPFSRRPEPDSRPQPTKPRTPARPRAKAKTKRRRTAIVDAVATEQETPIQSAQEIEIPEIAIDLSTAAVVVPPLGVAAALPMILQAAGASVETELAPVPSAALTDTAIPAQNVIVAGGSPRLPSALAPFATSTTAPTPIEAPTAPAVPATTPTAPVINIRRVTPAPAAPAEKPAGEPASAGGPPARATPVATPDQTIPFAARPISASASITPQAVAPEITATEFRAGHKGPERRKSPRLPLRARAIYRSDRDPAAAGPVQLIDVSNCGVRIWSPRPVKLGERGNVKLELGPVRFSNRVKIVACESNDEGFTVGCEFASTDLAKRNAA